MRVSAGLFMNESQFLEAVFEQLQLSFVQSEQPQLLVEKICHYAARLDLEARSLVLIVDDAHELGAEVLGLIAQLQEKCVDSSIHVLLFGENQLKSMLHSTLNDDSLERLAEFELEGLDCSETADYIRFKLAGAGFDKALPLPGGVIDEIASSSDGLPGAINTLAADALVSAVMGDQQLAESGGFWVRELQHKYWAMAGTLVLVLVATLIFWKRGAPLDASGALLASTVVNGSNSIQVPINSEPVARVESSDQPQPVRQLQAGTAESVARQITSPAEGQDQGDRDQRVESLYQESPADAAIETVVETDVEAVDFDKKQESTVAVTTAEDVSEFENGLLRSSPQNYSVQILGSSSEENVQNFIAKLATGNGYGYFETLHQGQRWYVVLLGNFPNRDAATRAISGLPMSLQTLQPWVRTLSGIQADIRQLN